MIEMMPPLRDRGGSCVQLHGLDCFRTLSLKSPAVTLAEGNFHAHWNRLEQRRRSLQQCRTIILELKNSGYEVPPRAARGRQEREDPPEEPEGRWSSSVRNNLTTCRTQRQTRRLCDTGSKRRRTWTRRGASVLSADEARAWIEQSSTTHNDGANERETKDEAHPRKISLWARSQLLAPVVRAHGLWR